MIWSRSLKINGVALGRGSRLPGGGGMVSSRSVAETTASDEVSDVVVVPVPELALISTKVRSSTVMSGALGVGVKA